MNFIEIQLSSNLVPLLNEFNLLASIAELRKQLQQDVECKELSIRVRDNIALAPNTYAIKFNEKTITNTVTSYKNNYTKISEQILNKLEVITKKYLSE